MTDRNYLKAELTDLIQSDEATWVFLQQGSLDGVWYWDLEEPDNEWMSPEFWQLFGIDPATKAHSPDAWQDIIFKEDLAVALKNFEAHCADPDFPYDQIVRYLHADGSVVWVRCRGLAIRDETGKPIRMLGAHTDLTAVKRLEEEARAATKAAQDANEDLRAFAYSISHDLKAPANTLAMILDEMAQMPAAQLADELPMLLDMGRRTVTHMQGQIDAVLDFTQMLGDGPQTDLVDLNQVAKDSLSVLAADIKQSQAKITIRPLPKVLGARGQWQALFQNLLSNAIKFRQKDRPPQVEVGFDNGQDGMRPALHFSDNGIGIPEDQLDRIFTLFERLHSRESYEGSGIGLAVCQRIARGHGAELTVHSTVGEGTRFSLALPPERIAA